MTIFLLRHGEAAHAGRFHDDERPLTDFGQRQAAAVGRYLAGAHAPIDLVYCSPLLRARQTAEAVQRSLGPVPFQASELLLSHSNPEEIVNTLQKSSLASVLLIGHEPHLSRTISCLLWGDERSRVDMRTCSLACVTGKDPIEKGRAMLQWLISSDQLLDQ
jgi:phosphohistidine phosphatase SixA